MDISLEFQKIISEWEPHLWDTLCVSVFVCVCVCVCVFVCVLCVPEWTGFGGLVWVSFQPCGDATVCGTWFSCSRCSRRLHYSLSLCANFQAKQLALTYSDQISPNMELRLQIEQINVGMRIIILTLLYVSIFR